MTEFVSDVKTILYSDADVYRVLSDPRNLEKVKNEIPEDQIRDLSFDEDSISFSVNPIGSVRFLLTEREPNKVVKLKSEKLPFDVFLWIQLVAKGEKDTRLRLTLRAELNPFLRGMVEKPMKEMLEKMSEALSRLPYDRI
ncbi:MAG TPA: SRPBCC family protein [Proteiniphilum sp.]|nr:SRPBCC family protein [Proteiniphilum sp.]HPD85723.1 SRPBCC family protein [Proteiniphilum sp.]HPJ49843.1 SRPBCC family protein [Proteiniphilum sp.]HPR19359.1 SRPBCC family protein [Proteiniphilum sp.]